MAEMTTRQRPVRGAALLALLLFAGAAQAAGGHHAVDDAEILEPGACKVDGWISRAKGGERLLHLGNGCRVGPVELEFAGEYARDGSNSQTGYGLQAKWAAEWLPGLRVGAALGASSQARARPRYQGAALVGLLTWAADENLALHLNLGRDFVHRGRDETRGGVAAEWTVRPGWSLLAERYREEASHFVRGGVRWLASESVTVDLSRAHRLAGEAPSSWTLGLSWQFDRP